MQGVCTQKHFPAVAQPFRVLWAPWPLAALSVGVSLFLTMFMFVLGFSTIAAFLLPVLFLGGHGLAVVFGLRMRYAAPLVLSIESRKTGSTNLGTKGNFVFGNI